MKVGSVIVGAGTAGLSALRDLAKGVANSGGSDLSDCEAIGQDAFD